MIYADHAATTILSSKAKRKQWLTSLTKQEMASASGQTASASQHENDARIVISTSSGSSYNLN